MTMSPEDALFERLQLAGSVKPTAETAGSPEEDRVKGRPDSTKPVTLRNLFTHQDAHPVVLDFALLKVYQEEWFRWEPETLWEEIPKTFSTQISELCRQKIRALQAVHRSVMPWHKWQVFEKVAQAFNGNIPNFKVMQALSLEELYAAVDILDTLKKTEFNDEVRLFMAGIVLHEDVFFVPPPLDFIQLEVSQPHYRCNDCGNEELALFHDGFCSNCTERLHPFQNLSLLPMQEKVDAGKGKNLTAVVRHDPVPIAVRWKDVQKLPYTEFTPNEESTADVQCMKLLLARDYMNIRRKQLAEQLTTLKSWMGAT